jgi:hypothetical protein
MFSRVQAVPQTLRSELQRRRLERQARAEHRRRGAEVALDREPETIATIRQGIGRLVAERRASLEADRADVASLPPWIRPVVMIRGASTRTVLWHRTRALQRALDAGYEALGRGAVGTSAPDSVVDPEWRAKVETEAVGFGRAVWGQFRAHLFPKAPALAGMVVGWWVANTYTDSQVRSVLHSVGIGSGGTRVVSGSTYKAMSFWLPLLAAALCAYLGERIWAAWAGRERREG